MISFLVVERKNSMNSFAPYGEFLSLHIYCTVNERKQANCSARLYFSIALHAAVILPIPFDANCDNWQMVAV
jgi:hypothetical protein